MGGRGAGLAAIPFEREGLGAARKRPPHGDCCFARTRDEILRMPPVHLRQSPGAYGPCVLRRGADIFRNLVASAAILAISCTQVTVATGGEPTLRERCDLMVQLLPETLQDLAVTDCAPGSSAQVGLAVRMKIPSGRLREVERVLDRRPQGMEPLRFVCCGFETTPVALDLPRDHPLAENVPDGAYRDVLLSLYSEETSNGSPSARDGLGGHLVLELVDY